MIYFDNASTTRVSEESASAALSAMTENFGNPSSLHSLGIRAEEIMENSAETIAEILGVSPDEIIFTSSGTEANNLCLRGALYARRRNFDSFIFDASSHESVTATAESLSEEGFKVSGVNPLPSGEADLEKIIALTSEKTALVSLMMINNETGSITDIERAIKLIKAKNKNTLVHIDLVSAFLKTKINLKKLGADLASISGHKIHAPKGIGAVYVKKGVRILPIIYGSKQQKGLRAGTESVPLIAAFGAAAEEGHKNMAKWSQNVAKINEYLRKELKNIPEITVNSPDNASPFVLNISSSVIGSEIMLHFLESRGIYLSSGSACSKGAKSHVLMGMGLPSERIETALRISLSGENTVSEAEEFIKALKDGLSSLQRRRK